jgi:hypothetical protein
MEVGLGEVVLFETVSNGGGPGPRRAPDLHTRQTLHLRNVSSSLACEATTKRVSAPLYMIKYEGDTYP